MKTTCRVKWQLVPPALVALAFMSLPVFAALSEVDIEKIVKKVMEDPQTRVTSARSGNNFQISAYFNRDFIEKDLKINAILIAKELFSAEPSATSVTVHYYDPLIQSSCKSVRVSSNDVVAFGAGLVDQNKLMDSLQVETTATALPGPKSGTSSSSSQSTSSSTTDDKKSSEHKSKKPASSSPFTKFSASGLSFSYPSGWSTSSDSEEKHGWKHSSHHDEEVRLKLNPQSGATVEFKKCDSQTAEEEYNKYVKELYESIRERAKAAYYMQHMSSDQIREAKRKWDWGSHKTNLVQVPLPKVLKFGVGQKFTGYQFAIYFEQDVHDRPVTHYRRTVVFGWPDRIYRLRLTCYKGDANNLNVAFTKLLSTVTVEAR